MAGQLHHFVPRFYLRQFVDRSKLPREMLWVYERSKPTHYLRTLDRVAAVKDYYAVELPDGTKTQLVERELSRIEGDAAPLLSELGRGKRNLSADERKIIATFVSLMWSRVPKFRAEADRVGVAVTVQLAKKMASDPAKFAKVLTDAWGAPPEIVEALRQAILAGNFEGKLWSGTNLQMMGLAAARFATMLSDMYWSFREADESTPLITSDSPVVLNRPPSRTGKKQDPREGMEIVFPVSPQLLFVATCDGHAMTGPMRPHLSRQINKLIGLWAEKYAYSPIQIPAILKYLSGPRTNLIKEEYFQKIMLGNPADTT